SAIPSSDQTPAANREWAEYQPTIWGDQFLQHSTDSKSSDDASIQQQLEELKQEVRKMLTESATETSTRLRLIDAVQRLGIGYHFTSEIENELEKVAHDAHNDNGDINDLYIVALRFRLLRQQGIKAAHLAIRGEDILDQALDFATTNLRSLLPSLSPHLAQEVNLALSRPIRKCLPRLDARQYIDAYSRDEFHNTTLLEFAKLDFSILQRMHQEELSGISMWWKDLDIPSRLPYARDRIVELYFWINGVYFEPQYSVGRRIVTKVISLLSILDDTYDNCGTCEELELLTEAIQRWDVRMIDVLPAGYMKIVYGILINVYNEIESDISKAGMPPFAIHYAKEAMKRVVRHYLAEARWRTRGYVPTMEEYMDVSLVSCCYPMLTTTSFLGMGPLATVEAFEWTAKDPKIIKAASIICRLMDDIASHQRDHVASAIECYMKQHGTSSEEEIVKIFREEIAKAWKDMNEECLEPTVVPMPLLQRVLNFARAMDVMYKDGDGYTNPHLLKDYVASLLEHPSSDDTSIQQQLEALKQEVRKMLTESTTETSKKLCLIDAVQRLGIGYHFISEIENELEKIAQDDDDHNGEINDLYTVALRDGKGKFKASLTGDVAGLLSLYEAAHLAIRGEDILDQALDFATTNLRSLLPSLSPHLAQEVEHALNRPIRKCLPRLEARQYIDAYSRDESHNTALLELAKLDFSILQQMHRKELSAISQWWKDLEIASRLPYVRDRIVELYFWIMGVYFEPQYALGRKIMTKVIAVTSLLDDTYDNYGTTQELELWTEAIQRWDVRVNDELPTNIKTVHGVLIGIYSETEADISKEGMPPYAIHYAKEAMKRSVRYYLAEAKWRSRGYVPTMEEYMDVSLVSSCYPMLTITSFLGMGPLATVEAFEWAAKDPKIIKAASIICRLMDDIVSQFERLRDHVASGIECYMKQHGNSSEEEIVKIFREEIANAWKDMNEECLKPTAVPMPLLERVLNFARVIDVIYKDGDGYTNPHLLKDYVASLLEHPL
ncbi:hypothetical protein Tsubulata_043483, partial [Turnera subulata]